MMWRARCHAIAFRRQRRISPATYFAARRRDAWADASSADVRIIFDVRVSYLHRDSFHFEGRDAILARCRPVDEDFRDMSMLFAPLAASYRSLHSWRISAASRPPVGRSERWSGCRMRRDVMPLPCAYVSFRRLSPRHWSALYRATMRSPTTRFFMRGRRQYRRIMDCLSFATETDAKMRPPASALSTRPAAKQHRRLISGARASRQPRLAVAPASGKIPLHIRSLARHLRLADFRPRSPPFSLRVAGRSSDAAFNYAPRRVRLYLYTQEACLEQHEALRIRAH